MMERFNKCKLGFHLFRCSYQRIIHNSGSLIHQFQHSTPLNDLQLNSAFFSPNSTKFCHFTSSAHFPQRFGLPFQTNNKIEHSNPFSPIIAHLFGLFITGLITIHCFDSVKTAPYINRKRFLPIPTSVESKLGNLLLERMKKNQFKGKILPATHPYSVRVLSIAQSLIDTLQRDLELEKISVVYHGQGLKSSESLGELARRKVEKVKGRRRKDVRHLEEIKWEVVVVDDPGLVNAVCYPGGIIVVFSGLLDRFCDIGVSTVIAHEVGHAVAQHVMEHFMYALLNRAVNSIGVRKFVNLMTLEDCSKRAEGEADYMALLLMASAGYDPHVVLQVYQNTELYLRSVKEENVPISFKERMELLSRPHVMEKACSIYRELVEER